MVNMPDFYFDMLCDRHFGQYRTALGAGSEHAAAIRGAVLNQKRERRIRLQTADLFSDISIRI